MNLQKDSHKKFLVRNPRQNLQKITLVADKSTKSSRDTTVSTKKSEPNSKQDISDGVFDGPELNTVLKYSKEIDSIVKPRKSNSLSDLDKKKLAVDEKIARKVNFPYDKAIYKDLIPLRSKTLQIQPTVSLRAPLPQKDKEPVFADFISDKKVAECHYIPYIKNDIKHSLAYSSSFKVYKQLESYKEIG